MKTRLLLGALVVGATTAAHGLATSSYDLLYDPLVGSLVIDTGVGPLLNYVIEGGDFRYENHQAHLGGTQGSIASTLSESNAYNDVSGVLDLGAVLESGLGLHAFAEKFARATYIEELGQGETYHLDILYAVAPDSPLIDQAGQYDDYDLVYHEDDAVFQIITRHGQASANSNDSPVEPEQPVVPQIAPRIDPPIDPGYEPTVIDGQTLPFTVTLLQDLTYLTGLEWLAAYDEARGGHGLVEGGGYVLYGTHGQVVPTSVPITGDEMRADTFLQATHLIDRDARPRRNRLGGFTGFQRQQQIDKRGRQIGRTASTLVKEICCG